MNAIWLLLICLGSCTTGIRAIPLEEKSSDSSTVNFIGTGTNKIATALFQEYVIKEDNMVYSPFGFSVLLAVLAEGAKGQSRDEIAAALELPKDLNIVRESYRHLLEKFAEKNSDSPEFKNWFYVFKNYTFNSELQSVLRKYYLTEVQHVERVTDQFKETEKASIEETIKKNKKKAEMERTEASPVGDSFTEDDGHLEANENFFETNFEKLKKLEEATTKKIEITSKKPEDSPQEPKKPSKTEEKVKKTTPKVPEKTNSNSKGEHSSKGSKVESTKGPVDKSEKSPIGVDVTSPETIEPGISQSVSFTTEKKEMVTVTEEASKTEQKKGEDEEKTKEKIKPIKISVSMGSVPKEHVSGMTDSSIKVKGKDRFESQMIVFNGMNFYAKWETPFIKKPSDASTPFYMSDKEKIYVPTIHSEGYYNVGDIAELDSQAIELPYKGGRYSLLLIIPNDRNGLTKLISDLSAYPVSLVYKHINKKLLKVCLPAFEINTISKPIPSLKKLGVSSVKSIFDPNLADFSGISSAEPGLYVDELLQIVTFKIDAEYARAIHFTDAVAYSRNNIQSFLVNQPFLFYLRDKAEDMTIVCGKVIDPTPKPAFYFS